MIKSQFNNCSLVWTFRSRQSNYLIYEIHEWSLRISYKDQKTSHKNLLETHNKLTNHQRSLQVLMTENYKIVNSVVPPIMNSLFQFRNNECNIRNFQVLSTNLKRTVNYGIETVTYKAPSFLAKLQFEYKLAASL